MLNLYKNESEINNNVKHTDSTSVSSVCIDYIQYLFNVLIYSILYYVFKKIKTFVITIFILFY